MRVSCITSFAQRSYVNYCKSQNNIPSFGGKAGLNVAVDRQSPFIGGLRNFTIKEYKHLRKFEIDNINRMINRDFLDKNLNPNFFDFLDSHDIASTGIKKALERKFGTGNFVVIPIGRSLSSIGKCLGYKIGEDNVKPLPMSQAARFIDASYSKGDLAGLHEYLNSAGLSKDEVKTSGKKYIFTDFCDSGASLLGAKELFSSKVYGELDNVEFVNIRNLLSGIIPAGALEKLEYNFYRSEFKDYSLVRRCQFLTCTPIGIIKPENYTHEAKCFYFKLLDNEMKKQK